MRIDSRGCERKSEKRSIGGGPREEWGGESPAERRCKKRNVIAMKGTVRTCGGPQGRRSSVGGANLITKNGNRGDKRLN